MIKKFFLLAAIALGAISAAAQHTPGSWKVFPMRGEYIDQILETPSKVYYTTGGSLYSYDKEYGETTFYAPGSRLSESGISNIYANLDSKYVAVIYDNSNIDLIYDDGRTINLPEIKNAPLTSSKKINHVWFANKCIYVATDFGIVIYDESTHSVKESCILGISLPAVMAGKDYLFTVINYQLCYSPIDERHNSVDKFTPLSGCAIVEIEQIDDNNFLYVSGSGNTAAVYHLTVDVPNGLSFVKVRDTPGLKTFFSTRDGFMAQCNNGLVVFNGDGSYKETISLGDSLKEQILSSYTGTSSVWGADGNGIACYDLSSATPTVLQDKFMPAASESLNSGYVTYAPDGSVYFTSIGQSWVHPGGSDHDQFIMPVVIEHYDWEKGEFTPVHPYGVTNTGADAAKAALNAGSKRYYGGPGKTLIDPYDPEYLYHLNATEGIVVLKDREIVHIYAQDYLRVLPHYFTWYNRVECGGFDQFGNLWIGGWVQDGHSAFYALPEAKVRMLREHPEEIVSSAFEEVPMPIINDSETDMHIIFIPGTNKMLYFRGSWNGYTISGDNKGTSTTKDDTFQVYRTYVDQDGNINDPQFRSCLVLDHNNDVWIGTTTGVFVVKDKEQLGVNTGSTSLAVVRPKVSRNDGTNYADYLLSTESVLAIAVDPSNRKWIATEASGVYLVSEDGTEIIEHFTKDNSPLVSNCVYTVACDPHSNDVMFGTGEGMFLYSSTSAPAAESYSEVYAFPNPVRPDYTGWITVNGLMDNSLVKIADSQGNVLWEGTSEGGMVVWDGCNRDGSRVRSGVYMVYASQNADGTSSGAVTKIVVIN